MKLFLDFSFSFSVQVLLPAAWTVTAEEAINEVYTDAQVKGHGSLHVLFQNVREGTLLSHQVRVWHTDPLHGDSPFTEQPGQCGEEGDFIQIKILAKIEFMYFYKLRCPNNFLLLQTPPPCLDLVFCSSGLD